MSVTVVTPPAAIVTLEQAKRHLRVEHDEDDAYITDLVEVATAWVDGPAGWLGRALGEQVLEVSFPANLAVSCRRYPCPPLLSVVSETPAADGRTTVVRYRAGYDSGRLPAPIRQAILLMIGHFYTNRLAVSPGSSGGTLPLGVDALLAPYRVWSL